MSRAGRIAESNSDWTDAALAAGLAAAFLWIFPSLAQDLGTASTVEGLRWVDPGTGRIGVVERPRRYLADVVRGGRLSNLARLGELAFRQPGVLGGEARLAALSCATCHPNGGANTDFLVPGLSDKPGNVDVTHRLFADFLDDGRFNPLNIPSLRGIAATAPYGRDGRIASLREFTRQVIVQEFMGEEPAPWLLDALTAYQNQLAFPPAPDGVSDDSAIARGRALFRRPFPAAPGSSCAACHPAGAAFLDGRRHDVGTGRPPGHLFDTPSLLGLAETAPYFHDGRAPDLAAVVTHFDTAFALALTRGEVDDLVAYLGHVGRVPEARTPIMLEREVGRLLSFLPLLDWAGKREFAQIGGFVSTALRREAGLIHARLPRAEGARTILLGWSRALRAMRERFERRDFIAARRAYRGLAEKLSSEARGVTAAAPGSLYRDGEIEAERQRRQR